MAFWWKGPNGLSDNYYTTSFSVVNSDLMEIYIIIETEIIRHELLIKSLNSSYFSYLGSYYSSEFSFSFFSVRPFELRLVVPRALSVRWKSTYRWMFLEIVMTGLNNILYKILVSFMIRMTEIIIVVVATKSFEQLEDP